MQKRERKWVMLRKAKKANSNSSSSRSRENWDVRVGGKSRKAGFWNISEFCNLSSCVDGSVMNWGVTAMYFSSAWCMFHVCDSSNITTKNYGTIPGIISCSTPCTPHSVIQAVDTDLKSGDVTSWFGPFVKVMCLGQKNLELSWLFLMNWGKRLKGRGKKNPKTEFETRK